MKFDAIQKADAAHFLPVVNRHPVAIVSASGSRLRDTEGKEYIDLMSGWGVTCIGHSHPALVAAIADQAGRLMQTTNIFYTEPQAKLVAELGRLAPKGITRSFFTNSGTEAVEGALKAAHRATGRPGFISTHGGFHGRTLGALHVIGSQKYRDPYAPLLHESVQISFDDLQGAERALNESIAALIVEPVQGEGGANAPSDGYLGGLKQLCQAAGALLICDEVQTGIGRTGTLFGCDHEGVTPDLLTLGKGLGGGFPVAGFLCTEAVAQTVELGDHGTTFGGNPLACAAALAVLQVIEEEKLVARSAALGKKLGERLSAFASERPDLVVGTRGRGLLRGLELQDPVRASGLPGRALERGVVVNVTAGTVVRFFPALNIPESDLFEALDILWELIKS